MSSIPPMPRMTAFLAGVDAVVFALGVHSLCATTVFSDATAAMIQAMRDEGVRRLIAVTGVGAGDSRGHGGMLYNRIIFPLFTSACTTTRTGRKP